MIGAKGVLILGNSGSGKSTLVHALIAHASRENQFARWVGDDQLIIQNEAGSVVAHAADTISGKAEQPFNGILDVPYVPSARIDLIVQLRDEADLERMPGEITDTPFPDIGTLLAPSRMTEISVPLIFSKLTF